MIYAIAILRSLFCANFWVNRTWLRSLRWFDSLYVCSKFVEMSFLILSSDIGVRKYTRKNLAPSPLALPCTHKSNCLQNSDRLFIPITSGERISIAQSGWISKRLAMRPDGKRGILSQRNTAISGTIANPPKTQRNSGKARAICFGWVIWLMVWQCDRRLYRISQMLPSCCCRHPTSRRAIDIANLQ